MKFEAHHVFDLAGQKEGTAIFVLDRYGNIYIANRHEKGKFHHSSLVAGEAVAAAGEIRIEGGIVKSVSRRTGHYKCTGAQLDQFIAYLRQLGATAEIAIDESA